MTRRDLSLPPAIMTMLSLWFDAVFRGVREAGLLVEQGQFVRARMIIKWISATLQHCLVLLAVRVEIKMRHGAVPPSPPATSQTAPGGGGAAAPSFPLWMPVLLSGRLPVFARCAKRGIQACVGLVVPKAWIPGSACGCTGSCHWLDNGCGLAHKLAVLRADFIQTRSSSNRKSRARRPNPRSAFIGKSASPPLKKRALHPANSGASVATAHEQAVPRNPSSRPSLGPRAPPLAFTPAAVFARGPHPDTALRAASRSHQARSATDCRSAFRSP
jgi:hypothetical protein